MTNAKDFMLIFRFSPNSNTPPTAAELETEHRLWGAFIGGIAIQEKLVSTHQLGFNGKKIQSDQSVASGIHISDNNTMSGNMIVRANSLDEAVEMAKDCPILRVGGSVEVRDIMPMS